MYVKNNYNFNESNKLCINLFYFLIKIRSITTIATIYLIFNFSSSHRALTTIIFIKKFEFKILYYNFNSAVVQLQYHET